MLDMKGRTVQKRVPAKIGATLLEHALEHGIDWGFSCTRGTCARCRCLVLEGMEHLSPVNDAEWERLSDEELEENYRLACQAEVRSDGTVIAVNKPYF